jgi:hypothetical protein
MEIPKPSCPLRGLSLVVWLLGILVMLGMHRTATAQVYQMHNDGKIWRYTGTPCSGSSCPGWQLLDNNPSTKAIAADGGALYQMHNDGKIWRYTGTPCSGSSCPGWQLLDNNPSTKAIAARVHVLVAQLVTVPHFVGRSREEAREVLAQSAPTFGRRRPTFLKLEAEP